MIKITLRERMEVIANRWDDIPIRAKINGRWGSYFLSELDDKTVGDWIIDVIQSLEDNKND